MAVVPFGVPGIDAALPGGGIARGALHEAAGSGPDTEHGATAALLAASVLARAAGPVLWVSTHFDLFAPALADDSPTLEEPVPLSDLLQAQEWDARVPQQEEPS